MDGKIIEEARKLHRLGITWKDIGARLGVNPATVRINVIGRPPRGFRSRDRRRLDNAPIRGAGADCVFIARHKPRGIKTVIKRDPDAVRAFAAGQISRAELVARLTP